MIDDHPNRAFTGARNFVWSQTRMLDTILCFSKQTCVQLAEGCYAKRNESPWPRLEPGVDGLRSSPSHHTERMVGRADRWPINMNRIGLLTRLEIRPAVTFQPHVVVIDSGNGEDDTGDFRSPSSVEVRQFVDRHHIGLPNDDNVIFNNFVSLLLWKQKFHISIIRILEIFQQMKLNKKLKVTSYFYVISFW